jgi:hypothetical protein
VGWVVRFANVLFVGGVAGLHFRFKQAARGGKQNKYHQVCTVVPSMSFLFFACIQRHNKPTSSVY